MELDPLIQYAILFLIALCLVGYHNWLLENGLSNPFKHSTIYLSSKENTIIYLLLFVGTVLLMFWFASISQPTLGGLIAIGVTFVSSLLIISTLKPLLGMMREYKLSYGFVINQNFLVTAGLIISTELSFLNWFKEITIYVQTQFFIFVILYSILILIVGCYLSIPKNDEGKKILPTQWRWRLVILLNPMIVVLLTGILVKLVLSIILLIQ